LYSVRKHKSPFFIRSSTTTRRLIKQGTQNWSGRVLLSSFVPLAVAGFEEKQVQVCDLGDVQGYDSGRLQQLADCDRGNDKNSND
jgi:hypothetical protein